MVAALHHPPHLANQRLKQAYPSWLWGSLAVAAALHFVLLSLGSVSLPDYRRPPADPMTLVAPPEFQVPPPPQAIARPVLPIASPALADADLTIPAVDDRMWERLGAAPPPPPAAPGDAGEARAFVPYEIAPRLLNAAHVQQLLARSYPAALREAGIGGTALFHAFVDVAGRVQEARLIRGSGAAALDAAGLRVLTEMRFSPARNRDRAVGVWVEVPVTFTVR